MSFGIEASTCGARLSMDRLPKSGEFFVNGTARAFGLEHGGPRWGEFPDPDVGCQILVGSEHCLAIIAPLDHMDWIAGGTESRSSRHRSFATAVPGPLMLKQQVIAVDPISPRSGTRKRISRMWVYSVPLL